MVGRKYVTFPCRQLRPAPRYDPTPIFPLYGAKASGPEREHYNRKRKRRKDELIGKDVNISVSLFSDDNDDYEDDDDDDN